MNQIHKMLSLFAVTLLLAACGGGGGTTAPQAVTKTATVAFSVVSTAQLPAPVQGVMLSAYLPAGTTVATDPGSNFISGAALAAGSGITSPNRVVFGTYSAAINKVKITVVTTEETFRGGECATLKVSWPVATTLTAVDFTTPNAPSFPFFEASGIDTATHTTYDLTGKVQASLGVTFN